MFPINNPMVDLSHFIKSRRHQLYRSRSIGGIVDTQRQFPGVPELHSRRLLDRVPMRRVEQAHHLLLIRIEGSIQRELQRELQRVAGVIVQLVPHLHEIRLAGLAMLHPPRVRDLLGRVAAEKARYQPHG